MRANAHCALWTAGLLLVVPVAASAQDAPQTVDDSSALVPEAPLTAEESAMLGNALVFDPAALATPPKKPLRLPGVSDNDFDITRTEMPDGSSTVVVSNRCKRSGAIRSEPIVVQQVTTARSITRSRRHATVLLREPPGHRSASRMSGALMRESTPSTSKARSAPRSSNRFLLPAVSRSPCKIPIRSPKRSASPPQDRLTCH
jgi:hypothetical protein